jgi:thiol-disulfide isomerase/thioredoxin
MNQMLSTSRIIAALLIFALLVACAAALTSPMEGGEPRGLSPFPEEYLVIRQAPELHDGLWVNTDAPLKLSGLRGKVVLLEMWTFACYNCQNVMPYLKQWHATYADQGLVVIGNHYPEFSFEADLDNLTAAVAKEDIDYPVIQDNDRETWSAYGNRYWPTLYLIDKQGNIRYTHIGEGAYDKTEAAIQALLAENYP